MKKNKVSIVIVNFNTPLLTKKCIDSLLEYSSGQNLEVIVIDNASSDPSFLKSYEKRNNFKIIYNKKNLGFAKANNQGILSSNGDYVLLLNSDTEFNSPVLQGLIEYMDKNDSVGVSSCGLLNEDLSIQGSGGYFPNLAKLFFWMFYIDDIPLLSRLIKPFHPSSRDLLGNTIFEKKVELDWLTGAFFLIRREVVDQIGGLDEDYFMYVEDVDYCYRAKKKGWRVVYLPKWNIIHLGGKSSHSEFRLVNEIKNIVLFYKKHYSNIEILIAKLIIKAGCIFRMMVNLIILNIHKFKIYAKALNSI